MFRKPAAAILAAVLPAMAGNAGTRRARAEPARAHRAGVRSGELNRPETRRLVRGEVRLHRHERIARSDGVVTGAERLRLQRNASRMSKRIYVQKHDPQSRPRSW
jgi:hypothetical protein